MRFPDFLGPSIGRIRCPFGGHSYRKRGIPIGSPRIAARRGRTSESRGVKPDRDAIPNALGETTVEEKVQSGLRAGATEFAKQLMRPAPSCQPVGCPEPVRDIKPGEEAVFRWGPKLPNEAVEGARPQPRRIALCVQS